MSCHQCGKTHDSGGDFCSDSCQLTWAVKHPLPGFTLPGFVLVPHRTAAPPVVEPTPHSGWLGRLLRRLFG